MGPQVHTGVHTEVHCSKNSFKINELWYLVVEPGGVEPPTS